MGRPRWGVERALEGILRPHGRGKLGAWQRWDWERATEAETHAVDPALGVIVEGSGLLTPATAALGDVRVWLEAAEPVRKRRALTRDGETYRPHWDRWAAQERAHIARDDPRSLATRIIDIPDPRAHQSPISASMRSSRRYPIQS